MEPLAQRAATNHAPLWKQLIVKLPSSLVESEYRNRSAFIVGRHSIASAAMLVGVLLVSWAFGLEVIPAAWSGSLEEGFGRPPNSAQPEYGGIG